MNISSNKVCIAEIINQPGHEPQIFQPFGLATKFATNQMNINSAIPFRDIKNYDASMIPNKSMKGYRSYLRMNYMAKASMVCLKNMEGVLTEDLDEVTQTFG